METTVTLLFLTIRNSMKVTKNLHLIYYMYKEKAVKPFIIFQILWDNNDCQSQTNLIKLVL